jgi:inhibitor of cysteine peptidase
MVRFTLAFAAALAMLTGCESMTVENPFNPAPLALRLDGSPASGPVTLPRGETLTVTLEANVTTGYRWEVLPGFAPTLAQIGTADYIARSTPPGVVGAPGDMTFRFRAETPGTTALELVYRRPFEPNVAPAKTVRYDVTVR